jgi:hypothetical protein
VPEQHALICTPTKATQDATVVEEWVKNYRRAGGKVPPQLQAALEAVKVANNIENSMNTVCEELARLLSSNQEYCARRAGFESLDDMERLKGIRWQEYDQYDICMLNNYYRTDQAERIRSVLYIGNPKSFVSTFLESTKEQLWDIIGRWLKGKAKERLKPKEPPYETRTP